MFGMGGPGYTAALNGANNASSTGAGYGSSAAGINSTLLPFLTRELNNPQGFTQQQTGSMLNQAEAGAGGATSGLTTEANLASARDRNSGGFSGALDEAARDRTKAISGASSGIATKDAELQQNQQQNAASGLGQMYGQDTSAQLKAMGLVPEDVDASTKAYGTGSWEQGIGQIAGLAGKIGSSFFPGGTAGQIFSGLAKV